MIVDCISDPNELIDKIGDRNFALLEQLSLVHPDTHRALVIIDCEDETTITICSHLGREETREAAIALLKLLNQEYMRQDGQD